MMDYQRMYYIILVLVATAGETERDNRSGDLWDLGLDIRMYIHRWAYWLCVLAVQTGCAAHTGCAYWLSHSSE